MTRKRTLRRVSAAGLLAVPIMISGCGPFGGNQSEAIDPPPAQVEEQMMNAIGSASTRAEVGEQMTVYLSDGRGMLVPVTLGIPSEEGVDEINGALEVLVKGGRYAAYVPAGFQGVLPPGTQVNNVTVDEENKLALVEFNPAFAEYSPQDERRILEALTWTLTGQEGIEQLQIWVDGVKLTEMPVNRTPLDRPLTRALGINIQKADDAIYSSSSPVTVYFSSVTPEGIQYYVPVTRLVPSGQSSIQAALQELIRGPQPGDGLESVISEDAVVAAVEQGEDGLVTVALQDEMFEEGDTIPSELLQAVVLTVSENTQDAKVKIQMNDLEEVVGTDSLKYSEPVTRPERINEISI